jgi:hypothetical protein
LYTTHGFTLISAVVEAVCEKPFEKVAEEYFRKLGLHRTFLDRNSPIIYGRSKLVPVVPCTFFFWYFGRYTVKPLYKVPLYTVFSRYNVEKFFPFLIGLHLNRPRYNVTFNVTLKNRGPQSNVISRFHCITSSVVPVCCIDTGILLNRSVLTLLINSCSCRVASLRKLKALFGRLTLFRNAVLNRDH